MRLIRRGRRRWSRKEEMGRSLWKGDGRMRGKEGRKERRERKEGGSGVGITERWREIRRGRRRWRRSLERRKWEKGLNTTNRTRY